MLSQEKAQSILYTSLYFHELFKCTLMAETPAPIETKTQINVAIALYSYAPMNMSALSAAVGIAPEQATRAVHALRDKGLVSCEKNPENMREVVARLTQDGRRIIDEQMKRACKRLEEHLQTLTPDEKNELVTLAQRARCLLEKTDLHPVIPHS